MRILIVNAYANDESGYEKFDLFQFYIMKFMAEQRELVDTGNEFFVRDRESIDDYLYEIESSYVKKESAQRFDQVDIIFLAGEPNVRPWAPSMKKIITLLRMCMKTSKLLFTVSFGMQALVFLSATNFEREINVINGKRGGNLQQIKTLRLNFDQLKSSDYFLDNTSGDLYSFNYDQMEWQPKANTGLHYRQAAQQFQSIGKYIVKAPIYKPKDSIHVEGLIYKNKNNESICRIKKAYYHHWAFQDVDSKFLVPLNNKWDVHTFSFINMDKQFLSLAETDEGPSVIEFKTFMACMFEIDPKYPHTLKIIKNFVLNSLKQIKSAGLNKKNVSVFSQGQQQVQSSLNEMLKQSRKTLELLQARAKNMGITAGLTEIDRQFNENDVLRHVGFSMKRSHMPKHIFENTVQKQKFQVSQKNSRKISNPPEIEYKLDLRQNRASSQSADGETDRPIQKIKDEIITQGEVRMQLHPKINEMCLSSQKLWIPGHVSSTPSDKNTIRLLTSTTNYRKKRFDFNYSYGGFSSVQNKYVTQDDVQRLFIQESDKKIIGPKNFLIKKTPIPVPFPEYLNEEYNDKKKEFRETHRDKWIDKDFILK